MFEPFDFRNRTMQSIAFDASNSSAILARGSSTVSTPACDEKRISGTFHILIYDEFTDTYRTTDGRLISDPSLEIAWEHPRSLHVIIRPRHYDIVFEAPMLQPLPILDRPGRRYKSKSFEREPRHLNVCSKKTNVQPKQVRALGRGSQTHGHFRKR